MMGRCARAGPFFVFGVFGLCPSLWRAHTIDQSGRLENCVADGQAPAAEGFGSAALKMSALFTLRPMTQDGAPASGATTQNPIRYVLPGATRYAPGCAASTPSL